MKAARTAWTCHLAFVHSLLGAQTNSVTGTGIGYQWAHGKYRLRACWRHNDKRRPVGRMLVRVVEMESLFSRYTIVSRGIISPISASMEAASGKVTVRIEMYIFRLILWLEVFYMHCSSTFDTRYACVPTTSFKESELEDDRQLQVH